MKLPKRLLLLAAVAAASAPARAQNAPPPAAAAPVALEPLRVTADLWESPLARIPASVSVYDDTALRVGAVRHFGDLADRIPNLTWTGGTSRPRYFQIRGIGENSQFEGETPDSTVRFLVDDLDFTGLGAVGATFDVSQVEVLRGAQAGAFGANAAGGVVRLVTQAPTPFWTGRAESTVGEDALRAGGFAVGGPLVAADPSRLMARLAVQRTTSNGFRRNVTLNRDTNARDELTARLRLTFNPAPAWRWEGAVLFSEVDNGYDDFALDNNGTRTFSDRPGRDEQRSLAGSLRGTYSGAAGVRVTSVTNASRTDSVYSYDDDWTAASYDGFSDLRRERRVFGQELRLDSAATRGAAGWIDRWTLGAYFARTDEDSAYTNEDPDNVRGLRTRYAADHGALFGQAAHDFAAGTRLTFGLRIEQVDVGGDGTRTRFRKNRGTFDPEATFRPDFGDTLVGGKLALEHDLSPRHLVFAALTRGYKAGGVNIDARINPPADPLTYATENLLTYEAGLRGHGFDGRFTGEFTVFLTERRATQVRDSAGFGGSYRFFTANGGDASVHGVEASGSFVLTPVWSLHGSLARMSSELDRFTLTNGNTGGGRRLANTPRYGYTVGTRYGAATGFFGNAELAARASQLDSNNHHEARRAFQVVNASLGYAWGAWSVTVWGRNLFDEVYENRVFFFGNEDPDYIETRYEGRADPRQFGVTAAYRW
jgi:outer membrane receptor protein involved in Fe transport